MIFAELKSKENIRFERKFRVEDLTKEELEQVVRINPSHFREVFHPRTINSIYLDTHKFSSYFENLMGIPERLKIRIRWYGSPFGLIKNPVLEIKLRRGFLGTKRRYALENFRLDRKFSLKKIKKIISDSKATDLIKAEIKSLNFSLFNTYVRRYFLSADQNFRLTIDYGVRFIGLNKSANTFLKTADDEAFILELKYNQRDDDKVAEITTHFPFRLTKNSKYVIGVERLNNLNFS
jgi:hypothetical protein